MQVQPAAFLERRRLPMLCTAERSAVFLLFLLQNGPEDKT